MNHKDALHFNGIHTQCKPIPSGATWKKIGNGTHSRCPKAGGVERFHSHNFDGPLWDACGCPEELEAS